MYSIAFPDMFTSSRTRLLKDHDATVNNLKLILKSKINGLFGDPTYGTKLFDVFFSQNGVILKDLVIDEIYTTIQIFIPQLFVNRNDIEVYKDKTDIYVNIKGTNVINYETDMYNINLTTYEET